MADSIIITGIGIPWDGTYEFEIADQPLTTLEWRWIKQISGYLPRTIDKGWDGRDPDLLLAFAIIALYRAGKVEKADAVDLVDLFDERPGDGTTVKLVGGAVPLEQSVSPPPPGGNGNGSSAHSGTEPSTSSDLSDSSLPSTGSLPSDGSSAPAMSKT